MSAAADRPRRCARDPLGRRPRGRRRAGRAVLVERGPAPAAWLSTATRSGPWPSTPPLHAAGRPSEAAVAYGAGHGPMRSPSGRRPRPPRRPDRPAARRLPGPGRRHRGPPGLVGRRGPDGRRRVPPGAARGRRRAAPLAPPGPGRLPGGGGLRRHRVAHPSRTTAPTPPTWRPPSAPEVSREAAARGRISLLNMYPIYHGLERTADPMLSFTDGVPTALNRAPLRASWTSRRCPRSSTPATPVS